MQKLEITDALTIVHEAVASAAEMLDIENSIFISVEDEDALTTAWRNFIFTRVIEARGSVMLNSFLAQAKTQLASIGWAPRPINKDGSFSKQYNPKRHGDFIAEVAQLRPEDHALFIVGAQMMRALLPQLSGTAVSEGRELRLSLMVEHGEKPRDRQPDANETPGPQGERRRRRTAREEGEAQAQGQRERQEAQRAAELKGREERKTAGGASAAEIAKAGRAKGKAAQEDAAKKGKEAGRAKGAGGKKPPADAEAEAAKKKEEAAAKKAAAEKKKAADAGEGAGAES